MKKLLSIFVATLLLFGLASAAEFDFQTMIDAINDGIPFGYISTQKISVEEITPNKIVIKSPIIKDDLGNTSKKYTLIYSKYPLSEIIENDYRDELKGKTFEFTNVGATISMELTSLADAITPSSVYYLSAMPQDGNNFFWDISNEIRFKLATQTHGEWTYSDVIHSAAGADMRLANATCPVNTTNNSAVCTWTAIGGSDKVDISVYNPTSGIFERLASVNMNEEKFSFVLTRNGEYIVKFVPNNNWQEYSLTFVANGITSPVWTTPWTTPPVIWKIPATWPKESILLVLAISVVLYIVYRRVRAKS